MYVSSHTLILSLKLNDEHASSGAACEAAKEGIPSTAFSAATDAQISFTTLTSSPNSPDTLSALLYAQLTANFTRTLLAPAARPILPSGVTLNVNYAATTFSSSGAPNGDCATASDFQWVFTRLLRNSSAVDVETCGSDHLPDETTVVHSSGCHVSVTVIDANAKKDVDATTQAAVLERISGLLTCF